MIDRRRRAMPAGFRRPRSRRANTPRRSRGPLQAPSPPPRAAPPRVSPRLPPHLGQARGELRKPPDRRAMARVHPVAGVEIALHGQTFRQDHRVFSQFDMVIDDAVSFRPRDAGAIDQQFHRHQRPVYQHRVVGGQIKFSKRNVLAERAAGDADRPYRHRSRMAGAIQRT